MLELAKENIIYLVGVVVIFFAGLYFTVQQVKPCLDNVKSSNAKVSEYKLLKQNEDTLIEQKRREEAEKQALKSHKVKKILEVPNIQFSPEASFASLSEQVLIFSQNSGIQIQEISYEYNPQDDQIVQAKQNYNVCVLNMSAIGSYTEFQNFFRLLLKEEYLINIAEVQIMPWPKDKTVLISNLKIKLYTKTI